jgi:FlaA1/EpsC-like NDP-sugar epimerase
VVNRDSARKRGITWLRLARAANKMSSDLQLAFLDVVMVAVAYTSLLLFRFEFTVPTEYWQRFRYFLPAVIAVHLVANRIWGCYGHMWQHASIQEARRLLLAGATAEVVIVVGFSFSSDSMPISVRAVGPLFATALMGAMRFQTRLFAIRRSTSRAGLRVVVIGAGRAGGQLVREMQHNDTLGLVAVAVVDDDRRWWGRTLYGVRVEGGLDDLERVVRDHEAHQVMLAIPSGGPEVARRVAEAAAAAGVPVKVLPSMEELIGGQPRLRDARDLSIDDLLSRDQVDIDTQEVAKLLRGRRVLVTGGGGWIGAEIARQVSTFSPAAIVLVDHDETHLFEAAQTVPEAEQALADIRDTVAIDALFARVQPDVVFHAAAHKHVPILESFAVEAATTNVLGTQNVVDAAVRHATERLVMISTDKAAEPTNVMGATKWLAEQVVLDRTPPGRRFCAVRFGNVLGSRGSVIPTFQRQIAAGGPVTVTDKRMTRFFMSTREAVALVLQAAAISQDREVLMLEMGEPVNIYDLAERMITLCGYEVGSDIEIQVTGMRPGERLTEQLRGRGERVEATSHPSVVALGVVRLPREHLQGTMAELEAAIARRDDAAAREQLLAVAQQAFDGPVGADRRPNGTGTGTNGRGRGDDTPHAGSTAAVHQS